MLSSLLVCLAFSATTRVGVVKTPDPPIFIRPEQPVIADSHQPNLTPKQRARNQDVAFREMLKAEFNIRESLMWCRDKTMFRELYYPKLTEALVEIRESNGLDRATWEQLLPIVISVTRARAARNRE